METRRVLQPFCKAPEKKYNRNVSSIGNKTKITSNKLNEVKLNYRNLREWDGQEERYK